jgi:hypothetical protein
MRESYEAASKGKPNFGTQKPKSKGNAEAEAAEFLKKHSIQ